jgi:PAP2 superfamily protein
MVNLQLDWQQATALAAALTATRIAVIRSPRTSTAAPYLQESAIIAGLYALWQLAATLSGLSTSGAFARGRWIERFQRDVGLPSERSVQQLILGHPIVEQVCNLYYASMHFGMLGVFLLWLFIRHRHSYPRVRNVLVVLTAACLIVQLIPVAPPRLFPDLGFVDVAAKYGQSVYNLSGITVDELGAMPSVHVGWAVLVGWAVVTISNSRYRWLALLHPVLTVFVVVATGNHFWMDAIVAVALLIASNAAVALAMRPDHRNAAPAELIELGQGARSLSERDLAAD